MGRVGWPCCSRGLRTRSSSSIPRSCSSCSCSCYIPSSCFAYSSKGRGGRKRRRRMGRGWNGWWMGGGRERMGWYRSSRCCRPSLLLIPRHDFIRIHPQIHTQLSRRRGEIDGRMRGRGRIGAMAHNTQLQRNLFYVLFYFNSLRLLLRSFSMPPLHLRQIQRDNSDEGRT